MILRMIQFCHIMNHTERILHNVGLHSTQRGAAFYTTGAAFYTTWVVLYTTEAVFYTTLGLYFTSQGQRSMHTGYIISYELVCSTPRGLDSTL